MSLSPQTIDSISHILGWLIFLILPLWLIFWLGRKAEPRMPATKSFAGMAVRAILALVLAAAFIANLVFSMFYWPPRSLTQLKLRAILAERLQKSGGWETVVKDCDQLILRPDFQTYRWLTQPPRHSQFVGPPDPLPAGLATLEPRSVHIDRHGTNQWAVKIILHQDALRHRFGILIICNAPTNAPALRNGELVHATSTGRRLADRVYEF